MNKVVREQTFIERQNQFEKRSLEDLKLARLRERKKSYDALEIGSAGICQNPKRLFVTGYKPFMRACLNCDPCRQQRRDAIYGGALGEAVVSSCVLSLTLTYRDLPGPAGQMVKPESAERLNLKDVQNMVRHLRRDGFNVRGVYRGEYGSDYGRAHFHVVLFFQADERALGMWADDFVSGSNLMFDLDWRERVPPLVVQDKRMTRDWQKERFDDPEKLLVIPGQVGKPATQTWKYWPHGNTGAYLVKDGMSMDHSKVLSQVIYATKYLYLCPWRDNEKWGRTKWEDLPEWVRQTAVYTKDQNGKWVYGNEYRKQIFEEADGLLHDMSEADFSCLPVEMRPYNVPEYKSARGGLGAEYLKALARYRAGLAENMYGRKYSFEGMRKPASTAQLKKQMSLGKDLQRIGAGGKWKFYMSDTQYLTFMREFYDERERLTGKKISAAGRCPSYVSIARKRARATITNQAPFAHGVVEKSDNAQIAEEWELIFASVPMADLKGLFPKSLLEKWLWESQELGWRLKRFYTERLKDEGPIVDVYETAKGDYLEVTKKRKLRFRKILDAHNDWFECLIEDRGALKRALAGSLNSTKGPAGLPVKGMRKKTLEALVSSAGARKLSAKQAEQYSCSRRKKQLI